jgi:predicted kinase
MPPDLHLISGGTGAGKTTYARVLAAEVGAVRFSIDEWMTNLFWMDSPQPIQFDWTMERIGRCEAMIRDQVHGLVAVGTGAILDLGFTRADHRANFAAFAGDVGMRPVLHLIDIPAEQRWQRVVGRNREKGETWRMDVDRDMFDFMEGQWQQPDAAELAALNGRVVQ